MANELQLAYRTGQAIDRYIQRKSDGQRWNGSAFEAFNAANWTTYAAALTEQGASGNYVGTFPVGITAAGLYRVEYRLRAGGSAAITDVILTDEVIDWKGTAEASAADLLRGLGLQNENSVIRSYVYDGASGNPTSAVKRVYDTAAHAQTDDGSTGLLAEYTLTFTYSGGRLASLTQRRTT